MGNGSGFPLLLRSSTCHITVAHCTACTISTQEKLSKKQSTRVDFRARSTLSRGSTPDHRAACDHCWQRLLVYHQEGIAVCCCKTQVASSTVLCDWTHPETLGVWSTVLSMLHWRTATSFLNQTHKNVYWCQNFFNFFKEKSRACKFDYHRGVQTWRIP